jgi:hypothetical protein
MTSLIPRAKFLEYMHSITSMGICTCNKKLQRLGTKGRGGMTKRHRRNCARAMASQQLSIAQLRQRKQISLLHLPSTLPSQTRHLDQIFFMRYSYFRFSAHHLPVNSHHMQSLLISYNDHADWQALFNKVHS